MWRIWEGKRRSAGVPEPCETGDAVRSNSIPLNKSSLGTALVPEPLAPDSEETRAKSYGNTNVHDNASLWQGDSYVTVVNNYGQLPSLQQDECNVLLHSLTFERMDARSRDVATAIPNTCQWLAGHECLQAWFDMTQMQHHHGFLWIKGKPGSGKSTIMKEAVALVERKWPTRVILTYFFNARSPNELEKSSLGLYRSLLHRLLTAFPTGQALFMRMFRRKQRNGTISEAWTERELQNFWIDLITSYHQLPHIVIFIDALDEGSEDDVRQMVKFLETLAQHSRSAGASLHICLSSRHYPHVSLQKGLSIIVENQEQHKSDIAYYVHSNLLGEPSLQINDLRRRVCDQSGGIFLWVVLIVAMLNKLYDQGRSLAIMLKKLDTIPQDLYDVFADILAKDIEDMAEREALFRWVLYSKRSVQPDELYMAIQISISETLDESANVTVDTAMRYLSHCSRGLIELTQTEPPTVQFIHETVRDFLIERYHSDVQASDGLVIRSDLPNFQADGCHTAMAEECLRYLIDISSATAPDKPVVNSDVLAKYAAQYWWEHARTIEGPCSQTILTLAETLLLSKTHVSTWRKYYDIDGFGEFIIWKSTAPPIYYAALVGLPGLVSKLCQQDIDLNAPGGRRGTALHAASESGYNDVVQILLDQGANVNGRDMNTNTPLITATAYGHPKIVQMLLNHGADVNAQGGAFTKHALLKASANGYLEVVEILLNYGADVNAQGGLWQPNALTAASQNGCERIVQLLLQSGANVNAEPSGTDSALHQACLHGEEKTVKILLDNYANINALGRGMRTALQCAVEFGHLRIAQLLIERGADVNAQSERSSALYAACRERFLAMVQLLLENGADVNVGHVSGITVLQRAVKNSCEDDDNSSECEQMLKLLLEYGADVHGQGGGRSSALEMAQSSKHKGVYELLVTHTNQGAGEVAI